MDDHRSHPDFRATIRPDGSIWLVGWGPWLDDTVAWHTAVASQDPANCCLLDFTLARDEEFCDPTPELMAMPLTELLPEHYDALLRWARAVGYRRIWIGSDVLDLQPTPGGTAVTHCRTCGHRLVGKGMHFWNVVRARGCFPNACFICGCDVAQWHQTAECESAVPRPRVRTSAGGHESRHHDPGSV